MSPTYKTKRVEHNYNLRKRRNKIFDSFRNQNTIHSPHKRCTDCGIKHKKSKLVAPKSKKSLYIEVGPSKTSKMSFDNRRKKVDNMPTAQDIRDDIRRVQNSQNSPEFLGFDNPPFRSSLPPETNNLDKKIAASVEKAVAQSQEKLTATMMNMMKNLMENLQINSGQRNVDSAHINENRSGNLGRGAIPRHVSSNTNRNSDRGNMNNADGQPLQMNAQGNNSLNVSSSTRILNSTDIHKWNLRFEKMSAKEFLNCVKVQWEVSGYTWPQIYYNFHYFLVGQKEKRWFYSQLSTNKEATWQEFSKAFNRRFGSYETDRQITTRMDQRKQGINEPFLTFLEDMEQMNASLEVPKSEIELVEFLRDNVNCYMRPFIWMKYAVNLDEFINLCVEAEVQIRKDKYRPSYQGRVSEVHTSDQEHKPDEQVEAFMKTHIKKEFHEMECWNCEAKGHFSRDCPSDKRIVHCFRCGLKGVTTPSCPKCTGKGNGSRIAK